jgi:hypothetical protein
MRSTSTSSSSQPIAKHMVDAGIASNRIGGSCGQVPLRSVSRKP